MMADANKQLKQSMNIISTFQPPAKWSQYAIQYVSENKKKKHKEWEMKTIIMHLQDGLIVSTTFHLFLHLECHLTLISALCSLHGIFWNNEDYRHYYRPSFTFQRAISMSEIAMCYVRKMQKKKDI